jgi:hypothetical protein
MKLARNTEVTSSSMLTQLSPCGTRKVHANKHAQVGSAEVHASVDLVGKIVNEGRVLGRNSNLIIEQYAHTPLSIFSPSPFRLREGRVQYMQIARNTGLFMRPPKDTPMWTCWWNCP